jgi:N-acetylneuraminic acid mutarotase
MTNYPRHAMALALSFLVLASCHEALTEPETAGDALPSPTLAVVSNRWITRANMPNIERWGLTSAVVPNAAGQSIFYAIGGSSASFPQANGPTTDALTKVQAYNAATNEWIVRASLPLPLYLTNGAGVINGKIYVSGGRMSGDKKYQRELLEYNPATNTWTRKPDVPACCGGAWGGLTGVINNKLYVLTCGLEEDCYIDLTSLELYRYDPETNQWTFLSFSPPQLQRPMGGVIGGKLYVTGFSGVPGSGTRLNVYDPATNQWTARAPMPRQRWSGAGVALAGKLHILGGFQRDPDGTVKRVRTNSVYDPGTNTWTTKAPMPTERFDFAASRVAVNGKARIEAVGGERPGNNVQYIP